MATGPGLGPNENLFTPIRYVSSRDGSAYVNPNFREREPTSRIIDECGVCGSRSLDPVICLGSQPLCNDYRKTGERFASEERFPIELLKCGRCELAQLSCVVSKERLFPKSYPYTSSTTRALRDNFADLAEEAFEVFGDLEDGAVIVDVGGNDGNLLSNFPSRTFRTINVTPEQVGLDNAERVTAVVPDYFGEAAVDRILAEHGRAKLVTATNVFAHVDGVHDFLDQMLRVLDVDGALCFENHHYPSLLEGAQFDAIYHEHLRYYSLSSFAFLMKMHGLEVFRCKRIPTHGGSLRCWVRRVGREPIDDSVILELGREVAAKKLDPEKTFRARVALNRRKIMRLIAEESPEIVGFGAPSRATVLIHHYGITESDVSKIYEAPGSHRIGCDVPGTRIPVVEEPATFGPPYRDALVFSHHVGREIAESVRGKGNVGVEISSALDGSVL